jgi:Predicted membrane protein
MVPLMLATVTVGLIGSALSVFGASVGKAIESHAPFAGTAFAVTWNVARWVIVVAAITLLLAIYYSYGPNRKARHWRWSTLGSAVGAVILVLASLGFSFYVKNFGSYAKIYGAFAGVVILIIWLYLGGLAVLVGAEINAESECQAQARASPRVA